MANCCNEEPSVCIANEDGTPYPVGTDVDGNVCIIVPKARKAIERWNSVTGVPLPEDCCNADDDAGIIAIDDGQGCATHVCDGANGWVPICGNSTPDPTNPTIRLCYTIGDNDFPLCVGGGQGSWVTNNGVEFGDITCPDDPVTSTQTEGPADPVEHTCDFFDGNCGSQMPNPNSATWTPGDTGPSIEATGNANDGWACFRPTFRARFPSLPAGGTGNLVLSYEHPIFGACINVGLWHAGTGQYLNLSSFATNTGRGYISGTGKVYAVNMNGYTGPTPTVSLTFANPLGLDTSQLQMIVTATGNVTGTGSELEVINDIELTGQFTTAAAGDCCECVTTRAQIAALLNEHDTADVTWEVDGNRVCATVPGTAQNYGDLTFCEQSYPVAVVTT